MNILSKLLAVCCVSVSLISTSFALERTILTSRNPELALELPQLIHQEQQNIFAPRCSEVPTGVDYIEVSPGQLSNNYIRSFADNTVFVIKAGVHYLSTPIVPRKGMQFYGEFDSQCKHLSIIKGAQKVTNWIAVGDYFKASINNAPDVERVIYKTPQSYCKRDEAGEYINPRCHLPEDLYRNDSPLMHVASLESVTPGTWFFDYQTGEIYIHKQDSVDALWELSLASAAFEWRYLFNGLYKPKPVSSGATENTDVGVYGLVIEKFATRLQHGAIGGQWPPAGWKIENNVVRHSHGVGIKIGAESIMRYNHVFNNGQLGIAATHAMHSLIDANHIHDNNILGINWHAEGGASKFYKSYGLRVSRNCVYENNGPGLWTDVNNEQVEYKWNIAWNNLGPGIFHEISFDAVIEGNLLGGNGIESGGQIYLSNSGYTQVYGNYVEEIPSREGASVNVNWKNRGDNRGERFAPALVDSQGALLSGSEAQWDAINNVIRHNSFMNSGVDNNDVFVRLKGDTSEQKTKIEQLTELNHNYYVSNNPQGALWQINSHNDTTGSLPRIGWQTLQSMGFESQGSYIQRQFDTTQFQCELVSKLVKGENPRPISKLQKYA
ncbi:right-handed parallel beta-helix repeat-containing protein [Pseudoalteromonas sp. T1lg23B]|uniref:right-handed parallel beta-helix repeat-containing protein n=1 Tax=Pseudoalteromonas sp. T1lg23B TaxID=2077097 RepID=UPI000CF5F3AB|nr:right-handed parallel beta-helix repeat-containing protein [Pseudoalteromonas sp. T1lg23B]